MTMPPADAANLQQGLVLWGRGGFYRVLLESGAVDCRLRGKLKRQHTQVTSPEVSGVFAGDTVRVSLFYQGENECNGMVEKVLPRKNFLPRPRIANIDISVAVLAARDPECDLLLLDKILLVAAHYDINAAVCFNKADMDVGVLPALVELYRSIGFLAIAVSAKTGQGIDDFRLMLKDKVSVLAGPSGVGKSSLLNRLLPDFMAPVGDISVRLHRGRHTTRHVSLLPMPDGGLTADSPGFSLLDLPADLTTERLPLLYPEFSRYADGCRFLGCRHHKEPGCLIKENVRQGRIDSGRYERYLRLASELK